MLALLVLASLSACKKDDFKPEESYIKIYNDENGSQNNVPISIYQTADQGNLILSSYDGWNIQLMKTDKLGELIWKTTVPSNYVNATNLIIHQGKFYFACMDNVGLYTYLVEVEPNSGAITQTSAFTDIIYPTYLYSNATSVYIQNYERTNFQMGISRLNTALTGVANSGSVNILMDVESKIMDHINHTGKRLPFFIQSTPDNNIIMNGFYNYSFSLVFLNANLQFTGVYNGANFNGGVQSLLPLGNSNYALSRNSFDHLYLNPFANLNPSTVEIAANIPAEGYPELNPEKPTVIKRVNVKGTNYIAMMASTKSNQVFFGLFDDTGVLKGKKYIGQNTPYVVYDAQSTSDRGMVLLIQVKLMGSYNRIALVRLSNEQLEELLE